MTLEVSGWSWRIEHDIRQLAHRHQRLLLSSLHGRTSPAAERFRAFLKAMDGLVTPPLDVGFSDFVIYRG